MPAFPAISLEGHAAAVHSEQIPLLALVLCACLCFLVWRLFEGRARWIVTGAVALLQLALAFTPARDVLHLLAGTSRSSASPAMCLFRALSGGFTHSKAERALHGTLGWFLLGRNVALCWGLVSSNGARALYHSNGSFGMTNDYIRVADDVLGWQLQSVAGAMLFAAALVLPRRSCSGACTCASARSARVDDALPYRTLAPWLQARFGGPVHRIALDAGSTLPEPRRHEGLRRLHLLRRRGLGHGSAEERPRARGASSSRA
jgi:hypothetical protein